MLSPSPNYAIRRRILFVVAFALLVATSGPSILGNTRLNPKERSVTDKRLWVAEYRTVPVLIEKLPTEAASVGIMEEQVLTKVELRLRQAGLTPTTSSGQDRYLYVNINVGGRAFNIDLQFKRHDLLYYLTALHTRRESAYGTTDRLGLTAKMAAVHHSIPRQKA